MSFPRYDKYKNSGVEWLGEVPEHWATVPLKHLAEFINGDAFRPMDWAETGIPIIRIQNLNGSEEFNYLDGEVEERYLVHDGDLLFGWSGNRGTSFGPFLWRRQEVCALNQHIFRVVPRSVEKQDLYWILKAVTAHVEDQAHGIIGMVHVTKGDLGAINVPVPDPAEQAAIATFLDRETAKIDALVEEQKRLIELLKEKRQAVISHAVTKGLSPNAPTKDSGVEWLGEVPEHWGVLQLRRGIARIEQGWSPECESRPAEEGEWGILKTGCVNGGRFNPLENKALPAHIMPLPELEVATDDLLVSRASGSPDLVGSAAHVSDTPRRLMLSDKTFRLHVSDLMNKRFLAWCLASRPLRAQIECAISGAAGLANNLPQSSLREFRVAFPPPSEQLGIAAFLDQETTRMDELIVEAELAMNLLQERRSALISAAVTGKIDVRSTVNQDALEAA